jgi:hypothetical protein
MSEEAALKDETKYYKSRLRHMVSFTEDHVCKPRIL